MSLAGRTTAGSNVPSNVAQRWPAHRSPRHQYPSNGTDVARVRRGRVFRRRCYSSRKNGLTSFAENAHQIQRQQEMTGKSVFIL